ncbi:unnamed protein product [Didymodactylos carnosus]|uniref:Uncharacterized protein n=1 Tax=Didymodactylos carnosus TaxID=1234261 RepID=A0A8S2EMI6_9BILA|nr:unnamed protein product [Didymodactylos carnosus]CAF4030465.1 unnamed protein product [Didymodactylos carnosus]
MAVRPTGNRKVWGSIPQSGSGLFPFCRDITSRWVITGHVPNAYLEDEEFLNTLKQSAYRLEVVDEVDQCLKLIHANLNKKVFIVSSGSLGKEIVPKIAGLPQLAGVLIFCANKKEHLKWTAQYCADDRDDDGNPIGIMKAVVDHDDDLLYHLPKNIGEYLDDALLPCIFVKQFFICISTA